MSNNNNTRNIYNQSVNGANNDEMELLLDSSNGTQETENTQVTTINIENDMTPGTSQQYLQRQQHLQQLRREVSATNINMEPNAQQASNSGDNHNNDDRQRLPNLFAMWREARQQYMRSQSLRERYSQPDGENNFPNAHTRTWRENLYEVLSSPVSPRAQTQVLRAIFNSSANARYETSQTNVIFPDDQFYLSINHQNRQAEAELQPSSRNFRSSALETQSPPTLRLSRQSSRITDDRSLGDNSSSEQVTPLADSPIENTSAGTNNSRSENVAVNGGRQRQTSIAGSTTAPTVDMIDDTDANAVGELIVKLVTHFIRYLPFIFIVFVKFIHDNLLAILDILILHGVVYHINKSVKDQVAKLNQKSYFILVRDVILATFVVSYRLILSTTAPDPFGLLINPSETTMTSVLVSTQNVEPTEIVRWGVPLSQLANEDTSKTNSSISVTTGVSLGSLLYYVAVNDLILKLLTEIIKIIATMLPTEIIRHKSRARLYALIETVSQFYRALVPIRQWLKYLYESYAGLEVISGILFASFYMGAKLYELFERGRPLKKALVNFMRNMDYDRKPTKDELEAAGAVCPICHDNFASPVILQCNHVFCDECVSTWFKREQTCPMCRAKVNEDPAWQNGATTFFYQLF